MSTQKPQMSFDDIYGDTYSDLLKYVVLRCDNFADVNDILQETYTELYKKSSKGNLLILISNLLAIYIASSLLKIISSSN